MAFLWRPVKAHRSLSEARSRNQCRQDRSDPSTRRNHRSLLNRPTRCRSSHSDRRNCCHRWRSGRHCCRPYWRSGPRRCCSPPRSRRCYPQPRRSCRWCPQPQTVRVGRIGRVSCIGRNRGIISVIGCCIAPIVDGSRRRIINHGRRLGRFRRRVDRSGSASGCDGWQRLGRFVCQVLGVGKRSGKQIQRRDQVRCCLIRIGCRRGRGQVLHMIEILIRPKQSGQHLCFGHAGLQLTGPVIQPTCVRRPAQNVLVEAGHFFAGRASGEASTSSATCVREAPPFSCCSQ